MKSPSARSDNLIYAYGEVPRALDLALRVDRGSPAGVVAHAAGQRGRGCARRWSGGFSQATDLAEYVMQPCDVDYRTAYQVVGRAVRDGHAAGLRGIDLDRRAAGRGGGGATAARRWGWPAAT